MSTMATAEPSTRVFCAQWYRGPAWQESESELRWRYGRDWLAVGVGPHVVLRMAVAVAAGIIGTRVMRADREYKPGAGQIMRM